MSVSDRQADIAHLEEGEEILGNVEYPWSGWMLTVLIGILLIPLGVGLVLLYLVYRAKEKSGCLVTNRRIVHTEAGLFGSQTHEIKIGDIRSISTYENLLGGGGIALDTGAGEVRINLSNPRAMVNVIREEMNRWDAG